MQVNVDEGTSMTAFQAGFERLKVLLHTDILWGGSLAANSKIPKSKLRMKVFLKIRVKLCEFTWFSLGELLAFSR